MSRENSPFKFLDSYQQADADVFFGREKETQDLYNALSGVKHLMVYGPSGSGKTSLVECGLRNQFSDADWYAITIRKGADINASVFASINIALKEKIETDPVTRMPVDPGIEFGQAIEKLFAERYQPVYLLFDQFEELLISGEEAEKKKFFTLLNKLIRNKVPCRIMLIMREEFIGHLSEFELLCPSIFQHRFRVEKMGRKHVEDVIYHILEAPRYRAFFNVDDSHKLAESILSKLPDRKKEIELAHVQVFLGELWDRAQTTNIKNELPFLSTDLIHDDDNLEAVLESFLKKQMTELEGSYGERVPLELLAAMISERFTKLQLSEAAIKTDLEQKKVVAQKPIIELLQELEHRRILRTLKAGDETQFEISHDVLALVVGQNLTEAMKMREKAGDIYKVYQERQGLFTQDDIDYLRPFEQSLSYPPEMQKRIDESVWAIKIQREHKQAITRKRVLTLYSLLGAALVALVVAVVFYFSANSAKKEAEKQTAIATDKTKEALFQKGEAETQKGIAQDKTKEAFFQKEKAEKQTAIATDKTKEALFQKGEAEKQKEEAEKQTKIAMANYLVSEAKSVVENDPTLALRLAEQAMKKNNSNSNEQYIYNTYAENAFYKIAIKHPNKIKIITLSPDGKTILAAYHDRTACLFGLDGQKIVEFNDIEKYRVDFQYNQDSDSILSATFSPDGKSILFGFLFSMAQLYEPVDGVWEMTSIIPLEGPATFSPDGRSVLIVPRFRKSQLFRLDDLPDKEFEFFNCNFTFSPDGKSILHDFQSKDLFLVGVEDNNGIYISNGDHKDITTFAFSPDGSSIISGSSDKLIRLFGLDGKLIKEFRGHTGAISSVAFSPNGKTIISGSTDGTARLWDLEGVQLLELKGHTGPVSSATFFPDNKTVLTSSKEDSTSRIWRLQGNQIMKIETYYNIGSFSFSPDGKIILMDVIGPDRYIMWGIDGNEIDWYVKSDTFVSTRPSKFSPDGLTILSGSSDLNPRLWDLDGNLIKVFKGNKSWLTSSAFSPDGNTIFMGYADNTARTWGLDGLPIMEFTGHTGSINSVAFSPDSKTILTGSSDSTARIWGLDGHQIIELKGHSGSIHSVAFSKDGTLILTGSSDATVRLWGLDGHQKVEFKVQNNPVNSFAFSPDGKTILIGSDNKTARLFTLEGKLIKEYRYNGSEPIHRYIVDGDLLPAIVKVAFSPNGEAIITGDDNGTARLWDVPMPLDEFLNSDKIEPLTPAQKEQYGIK